jgi:hypothetical protein
MSYDLSAYTYLCLYLCVVSAKRERVSRCVWVHTQTHRHTDTQTHRHTDTQTRTHTHTHTNTHTNRSNEMRVRTRGIVLLGVTYEKVKKK